MLPASIDPALEVSDAAVVLANTLLIPLPRAERMVRYFARRERGRARNTNRAFMSDLKVWSTWCRERKLSWLAASAETVCRFIDAQLPARLEPEEPQIATFRKPATVRRYLASIATAHRAAGMADPTRDEEVGFALSAHARMTAEVGHSRQRQATGLQADAVDCLLATLDDALLIDQRDRALVLTARDLMARRSELVALRVDDLRADPKGNGGTVLIRRSKTDQAGEGVLAFVTPETYAALRAWVRSAALTSGLLFRAVNVHGAVGRSLQAQGVSIILKKLAARCEAELEELGVDVALISGHSCRVGAAQDLVGFKVGIPAIMLAGRWKSAAMVVRYAEALSVTQGAIAQFHTARREAKSGEGARQREGDV